MLVNCLAEISYNVSTDQRVQLIISEVGLIKFVDLSGLMRLQKYVQNLKSIKV